MIGHMMLSRVVPEFALDADEAQQLAEAICNYLRHTKVKVDPKTRDFLALLACCGMIYGPRLIAATNRAAAMRAAKKNANTTGVVPMQEDGSGNVWHMPTSR
jgi:hypothetical protein